MDIGYLIFLARNLKFWLVVFAAGCHQASSYYVLPPLLVLLFVFPAPLFCSTTCNKVKVFNHMSNADLTWVLYAICYIWAKSCDVL